MFFLMRERDFVDPFLLVREREAGRERETDSAIAEDVKEDKRIYFVTSRQAVAKQEQIQEKCYVNASFLLLSRLSLEHLQP